MNLGSWSHDSLLSTSMASASGTGHALERDGTLIVFNLKLSNLLKFRPKAPGGSIIKRKKEQKWLMTAATVATCPALLASVCLCPQQVPCPS